MTLSAKSISYAREHTPQAKPVRWLIKSPPRLTGFAKRTQAGFKLNHYRATFISESSLTPGATWEERTLFFYARKPSAAVRWILSSGVPLEWDGREFDGR